jgi:hypothetical protein
VCSPDGGALKGVSLMVFLYLRRTHEYKNLPFRKQLSFNFLDSFLKRNISMGRWEHIKLGELPWHNTLGFFC